VPDSEIVTLDRFEIIFEPWSWPFAADRRADIDRFFASLQRERPGVWNGRALLLQRYAIEDGILRGCCFETDYASLCAWRDWQLPDRSVHNVFSAAALQSADGAWLLGEMARDTAAAGLRYFPCGTPEPDDIDAAGKLDLAGNLTRELHEETGLDIAELTVAPGWNFVRDRSYIALMKRLTAREPADELRSRIMRYIARQERPELVDIHIVRSTDELDPALPRFMTMFLEHAFGR
jgi:8-oxo-dGTP pyrophosphatase MutT (NUDIX family)